MDGVDRVDAVTWCDVTGWTESPVETGLMTPYSVVARASSPLAKHAKTLHPDQEGTTSASLPWAPSYSGASCWPCAALGREPAPHPGSQRAAVWERRHQSGPRFLAALDVSPPHHCCRGVRLRKASRPSCASYIPELLPGPLPESLPRVPAHEPSARQKSRKKSRRLTKGASPPDDARLLYALRPTTDRGANAKWAGWRMLS
jgi:hypothetical protein